MKMRSWYLWNPKVKKTKNYHTLKSHMSSKKKRHMISYTTSLKFLAASSRTPLELAKSSLVSTLSQDEWKMAALNPPKFIVIRALSTIVVVGLSPNPETRIPQEYTKRGCWAAHRSHLTSARLPAQLRPPRRLGAQSRFWRTIFSARC